MKLLEMSEVSFSYGRDPVVRGVSLTLDTAGTVALLGPNGAGKSTLTKLMMALLHPDKGRVLVDGLSTEGRAPEDLARIAAYVFQHADQQLFAPTVIEEVAFGPRQLGLPDSRDLAFHALLEVGLERETEVHPFDLAPAQRKLLSLAAALAQRPRILILDEPTQGLDRASRDRVVETIRQIALSGTAVFAVTHDLTFVAEALERTVVMTEGRIVSDVSSRDFLCDVERVRGLGLAIPPAAQLSLALELTGTPIRFAEVVEGLKRCVVSGEWKHPNG